MEHLAIMHKSWNLTNKILTGEKKIESRWYKNKYFPWDNIKENEIIYFKDSGDQVNIKAQASKILQFDNLNHNKVKEILYKYAKYDGIEADKIDYFYELFKDKKYCILIFLKNVQKIQPFDINKKGFGIMSAWITLKNIKKIKI